MSDEELELENQLADIPFEDLQRARADGSLTALPGKQKLKQKTSRANKKRSQMFSNCSFDNFDVSVCVLSNGC